MLLGLIGCQSTPKEMSSSELAVQLEQDNIQNAANQQVIDLHDHWAAKLSTVDELEIYAPENYHELMSAWKSSQSIYTDLQSNPEKVASNYSIFSNETYQQAFNDRLTIVEQNYHAIVELKQKADVILADAISQMEYLDRIEAQSIFNRTYRRIHRQYRNLFSYIVVDDIARAEKQQTQFLKDAKELEVQVMKEKYVKPLNAKLQVLKGQYADNYVPESYAQAARSILTTQNVIAAYPRDLELIEKAVAASQFEMDRVHHRAKDVESLISIRSNRFEPAVVDTEKQLYAISQAIDNGDYRNLSVEQQKEKIIESITQMHSSDQTLTLQKQVKNLIAENKKLANQLRSKIAKVETYKQQILDLETDNASHDNESLDEDRLAIEPAGEALNDTVYSSSLSDDAV